MTLIAASGSIDVDLFELLVAFGVVALVFWVLPLALAWSRSRHQVTTASLNLPLSLGSMNFQISEDDRRLAWELYVQLTTRKAALPFDRENDVVADVHESLYQLFPITRELLSDLPLADIRRRSSVGEVMLRFINGEIRDYLTKWHARFTSWQEATPAEPGEAPQERQRRFSSYDDLIADLESLNAALQELADELLRIAKTPSRTPRMPAVIIVIVQRLPFRKRGSRVAEVTVPSDKSS